MLQIKNRFIRVAHVCDVHFPHQDDVALALYYDVFADVKPHIAVVGSDTFDFALISSFGADPDLGDYDELDIIDMMFTYHIQKLRKLSPNTVFVYIKGNHEHRIENFIKKNAQSMRRRVMRDYESIIKQSGEVLFLGHKDWVRIGPLIVQHGNRLGDNPAKLLLSDLGYQVSTMAGHVHKISDYAMEGEDFTAKGITSGCLEQLPEFYYQGRRRRKKANSGSAFATVNLLGKQVWFDNLKFEGGDGYKYVRLGNEILSRSENDVEPIIELAKKNV